MAAALYRRGQRALAGEAQRPAAGAIIHMRDRASAGRRQAARSADRWRPSAHLGHDRHRHRGVVGKWLGTADRSPGAPPVPAGLSTATTLSSSGNCQAASLSVWVPSAVLRVSRRHCPAPSTSARSKRLMPPTSATPPPARLPPEFALAHVAPQRPAARAGAMGRQRPQQPAQRSRSSNSTASRPKPSRIVTPTETPVARIRSRSRRARWRADAVPTGGHAPAR